LNNPGFYIKDSLDLEQYFTRKYSAEFLKGSALQVTDPTTKKLIGVPYDLSMNGPIINVDQFKKAGIPVPTSWNWAQLIDSAKKVQKANGTEYAFAMDKSGHRFSTVMSQFGAYMVDKNQRNVLSITPNRAEKALKLITDLYKADQAPRDLWIGSGTKYASPVAVFIGQQVPVFFSGNFNLATLVRDAKFNFQVVPNPKELNGGGWPGGGSASTTGDGAGKGGGGYSAVQDSTNSTYLAIAGAGGGVGGGNPGFKGGGTTGESTTDLGYGINTGGTQSAGGVANVTVDGRSSNGGYLSGGASSAIVQGGHNPGGGGGSGYYGGAGGVTGGGARTGGPGGSGYVNASYSSN
ncbi:MAG: extracellular solute-binding protein, partial [Micrococcales bacterium]|nr:extracellular solute-binding protein [Micrococcales bacterium]